MYDFAEKGQPGGANGMAALAIVRALLRQLNANGSLSDQQVSAIVADALSQIPKENNDRANEAQRLIQGLGK